MVLIYISLIISDVEHLFMCLVSTVCLLGRNVYLIVCPVFDWVICFLDLELHECMFWRLISSRLLHLQVFAHAVDCLHFAYSLLCCEEASLHPCMLSSSYLQG